MPDDGARPDDDFMDDRGDGIARPRKHYLETGVADTISAYQRQIAALHQDSWPEGDIGTDRGRMHAVLPKVVCRRDWSMSFLTGGYEPGDFGTDGNSFILAQSFLVVWVCLGRAGRDKVARERGWKETWVLLKGTPSRTHYTLLAIRASAGRNPRLVACVQCALRFSDTSKQHGAVRNGF